MIKKLFFLFLIFTLNLNSSEIKKFFNPRTIIVDEISQLSSNKKKEIEKVGYKSDVEYIFIDGKKFNFSKTFELNGENNLKIKIYKFKIKVAEFISNGEDATFNRIFKDEKKRSEENLNLRIFTKRLDLPIKTFELINILKGTIFTPFESAKILPFKNNILKIKEDGITFFVNDQMQINKVSIDDGRYAIVEYFDFREIEGLSYKVPFKISLKTNKFKMFIKHKKVVIKN
tara:strand:- start:5059 stop:5748 length:690 start_codon:yes stop_codon:yes gene_type:complete